MATTKKTDPKKAAIKKALDLSGYDPFNGLVTCKGLKVTQHRKGNTITAKSEAEARAHFETFVADTVF